MDPYLVVGGGVSGIAAAHYLREAGASVELLEQDEVLGGRVAPALLGERPIELGGKNIGRRYTLFREFARKMGPTEFEFFGINSSRVLDDGRLLTVDSTRRWRSLLGLLRACPLRDLWRFGRLALQVMRSEADGYLGGAYFAKLGERRDDRPLAAWFSRPFADKVLRPLSLRMNGAEPDEVYLGTLGTNLRSLLDTYDQPKQGMRPLFSRFATEVPVHLGVKVRSLVIRDGKVAAVSTERADGQREERPCAGVVLAAPAAASAALLEPHLGQAAEALRNVRYFPVLVVVARYRHRVFSPAVRALVFGAESPLSNAGAYGVEALDTVRYTFSGRAARKALNGGADVASLLAEAEGRLGQYTELRPSDRLEFVARRFDPGLCAYSPRHGALHRAIEGAVGAVRGLALTGDYVCGASIEACFRAARTAVSRSLARA